MKIIICDDRRRQGNRWARQIRAAFGELGVVTPEISAVPADESAFSDLVGTLNERRLAARLSEPSTRRNQLMIDDVDVLIIDFDLIHFGDHGDTTGTRLAYLARCYSSPRFIIVLNEFGTNRFDLRMTGNPQSFADLDMGGEQIGNVGLWSHTFLNYRPWSWPIVPEAVRVRERLVRAVSRRLEEAALPLLGFDEKTLSSLSDRVVGWLGNRDRLPTMTFEQLVTDSPLGVVAADELRDDKAVARVAVARLTKWLVNVVLPRQDILVDAPHLVSRFPSLLAANPCDSSAWAQATSLATQVGKLGVRSRLISDHHFPGWEWIGRHCWVWSGVAGEPRIEEVTTPWSRREPEWVFAEDSSRFVPSARARRFVAGHDSPFRLRYVERPVRGVEYNPASSLE